MLKKEYPSIYFLKGICSVLVVLIHAQFFFHNLYVPVYRLAVPLFFIISGFFLLDEAGFLKKKNINKAIKKMLKINIVTSVIYILYSYIRFFFLTGEINLDILFPQNLILSMILGHPYCGVLWYVTAYIEVLLVLKVFGHFHKENLLFYVVPIFLLLELLFGKYSFLLDYDFNHFYHRNFFTMGLPFVLIGMAIRKYHLSYSTFHISILSISLLALSFVEYFLLQKYHVYREGDIVITTIFLAPILFLLVLKLDAIKIDNIMAQIGKKYSLNLYLYHPMVISIFYTFHLNECLHDFEYPFVLLVTLLCCTFVPKMKKIFNKE